MFSGEFLVDLSDHGRGAGFFMIVATYCVLGIQFSKLNVSRPFAVALWILECLPLARIRCLLNLNFPDLTGFQLHLLTLEWRLGR